MNILEEVSHLETNGHDYAAALLLQQNRLLDDYRRDADMQQARLDQLSERLGAIRNATITSVIQKLGARALAYGERMSTAQVRSERYHFKLRILELSNVIRELEDMIKEAKP